VLIATLYNGARYSLRSWQSLSPTRNSQPFKEPKGSLPCSQKPATGPYPEPVESSLHLRILIIFLPLCQVYQVASSLRASRLKFCRHSYPRRACYMSLPSHSSPPPILPISKVQIFSSALSYKSMFFLSARDQVPHPCKTTGNIKASYILFFTFLGGRRKDKLWAEEQQTATEFRLLLIPLRLQFWSLSSVLPSFSSLSLIVHSEAKMKSSGDKASPCFRPFLVGNGSDTFLPIRTSLYVSFKYILISLTNFMLVPNSLTILYNTSLLTESHAFSKSINIWCTVPLHSRFLFQYPINSDWSVADLVNWHVCSW